MPNPLDTIDCPRRPLAADQTPSYRKRRVVSILTACWVFTFAFNMSARGAYQEPAAFIDQVFSGDIPKPSRLWIKGKLKEQVREILGRDLNVLRLRYWGRDGQTAWILEEIGKEKPITVGIVVDNGTIERIKILVFRESRGWEVKYPFFTDQFKGVGLTAGGHELDRGIDGISGATLSVRALTKLARLSILLHQSSEFGGHAEQQ